MYKSFCVLRALTCPSWCIRTPPGCPPPHAGEAKLRPTCPANAVIILLESTCPFYGQAHKSIMTYLPSENETYLVSPACGGDVEAVRPRQRGHEKRAGEGLTGSTARPCQERLFRKMRQKKRQKTSLFSNANCPQKDTLPRRRGGWYHGGVQTKRPCGGPKKERF